MKNKILVIDDEFLIRYTLAEGLKDRGYETESAGSVEEGLEKMKTFGPEVILLDNLLENSRGMDEIPAFRKLDENVQVIMMTAYGSVSQAVEAIKQGAYDYVLKPFDIDEIEIIISRSLESVRNRESLEFLKGQTKEFLGSSESARRKMCIRDSSGTILSGGFAGSPSGPADEAVRDTGVYRVPVLRGQYLVLPGGDGLPGGSHPGDPCPV